MFSKIVQEIRTVRDYKKDPVDHKLLNEIIMSGMDGKGIVPRKNISILIVDNDDDMANKLSGKAGYFGKIIEAPHYLVLTSPEFPSYIEHSGYIMELMRFKAWELGLGTCWLNVENEERIKELFKIENNDRITALVAIGHQYRGIFKTDMSEKSSRLGIEEIVYENHWGKTCSLEDLENRGLANIFYYTRYAPSWGNKQLWRFIFTEDKIILSVPKEGKNNTELDAGIVMYYLEMAAHEEGINGSWVIKTDEDIKSIYDIPTDYEVVGYYPI